MSAPHLTDAEISEITKPLTQGAARIKYFRKLGIKVQSRPNGQPLVGRAEFEAAMMDRKRVHPGAHAATSSNVVAIDWTKSRGFRNSGSA